MERAELLDILTDASRLYVNYVEQMCIRDRASHLRHSALDGIEGVGPARKTALLKMCIRDRGLPDGAD